MLLATPLKPKREKGGFKHIPTELEFVEMVKDEDWDRLNFFRKLACLEDEEESKNSP